MRVLPFLAVLPALAAAQEQTPLVERVQGWFNKAKSYLPSPTPVAPVEKVTGQIAQKAVTPFNLSNWHSLLEPSSERQEWLVFVTGGNKTCFGRCGRAEKAFNESILLFSVDRTSPHLGSLNCEKENVLCSTWFASPPTVWHFQIPQAQVGEERLPTPLHIVPLNTSTITPEGIYKIHSEKNYETFPAYEGALHPTDGWLAKTGLNVALGYIIFGFSAIPSWLFMIGVSLFSRTFAGRRFANQVPERRAAQAGRPN